MNTMKTSNGVNCNVVNQLLNEINEKNNGEVNVNE